MRLIDADAAIDALMERFKRVPTNAIIAKDVIKNLPSVQPERTGRWILEQLRKAVLDGKIKVNTNRYGYIQLIDIETGTMIVIGNIGGEEE